MQRGENGLMAQFDKIFSNLSLFAKYLVVIYHSFVIRICETRVLHGTQVYENRVP